MPNNSPAQLNEALLVAVFARSDELGGAERGTIELAGADIAIGRPWLVVVRDKGPGPVNTFCSEMHVPVVRVRGPVDAIRTLRRVRPLAIWIFGLRWSSSLRLLSRIGSIGDEVGKRSWILVAQRGLDEDRPRWQVEIDRLTQRFVDMYVANSDAAAEMLKSRIGISPKRVSVIHSGLGDRWFETPTYRKKRNGPPRILLVGNNRAEKAYEDALEILSQTVGEEWVATIYSGRGDDLRQRVRRRGLEPRVVVVSGHQLTPADYDRADILLHAANSESYPRAVLEARARGLAIAATDVGDVRYLVEPEDLFNPGDVDRASSILRRHLTHEQVGPVRPRDESGLYSQTTVGTQLRHLIASLK